MAITVECPCGKRYRVANEHAGKLARCRNCNRVFRVGGPKPPPLPKRSRSPSATPPLPAATAEPAVTAELVPGAVRRVLTRLRQTPDQALAAFSAIWVLAVLLIPGLVGLRVLLVLTCLLIVANLALSLAQLFRRGVISVLLNVAQLVLFCLLNYQLFRAFGETHFRFEVEPGFLDWIQLTLVHLFRAIDILDGIEAYGFDLQNIKHNSVASGLLLVWMHLTVDLFLIGLLVRWLVRFWRVRQNEQRAQQLAGRIQRARVVGLPACAVFVLLFALVQGWRSVDWMLWPLDNVLRTVDIGDAFQIFDWRLHHVGMGFWTTTLALSFRLLAGRCESNFRVGHRPQR